MALLLHPTAGSAASQTSSVQIGPVMTNLGVERVSSYQALNNNGNSSEGRS